MVHGNSGGGGGKAHGQRQSLVMMMMVVVAMALLGMSCQHRVMLMRPVGGDTGMAQWKKVLLAQIELVNGQVDKEKAVDVYPPDLLDIDWEEQVAKNDLLHLTVLHRACTKHKESIVSWQVGINGSLHGSKEGYGHYINQARAAGGLIVTPNVAPMNELVTPDAGVLVNSGRACHPEALLCGSSDQPMPLVLPAEIDGFVAEFDSDDVCAAIDVILTELSPFERARRAKRARQQYLFDTVFFAHEMRALHAWVQADKKQFRSSII
ncbi:TPA: hypothetical protein N0F65_008875 [Lagenidium giganteum]|uniref:Uncharacterized protein n=1 Tax=Lagenidium giganteum TaxID=4803 RepID=A0AAV2YXY8_9STRA|nr:TPA: hypothetical protein N0F65_008875 [Lagenidium giganteum]